jgi:hypothetical protein
VSNLINHARAELEAAGWFKPDGMYGGEIGPAVLELIQVFAAQGHSGMSASIVSSLFDAVSRFQPIGPLTGADDEWEPFEGYWQNKRCSRVFKNADGTAYDIEGRIFREPSGHTFTNRDSCVFIKFPYAPKREYVDVD